MMRGFSLMELMIATLMIGIVGGAVGGLAWSLHKVEATSAAYHQDLSRLRRVVQDIERDLRSGSDADYKLTQGVLTRNGVVSLRGVEAFEVERAGKLATVRLVLAPRTVRVATRRAEIRTEVAIR